LYDARNLGAPTPRHSVACIAGTDNRFEFFARDAILLADADRPEAPGSNIGAHGPHMKPEPFGNLVE
jgi:hypothetical protein